MTELQNEENIKLYRFLQILLIVLSAVGLVITIVVLASGRAINPLNQVLDLIIYFLVIFYFIFWYKKPHSNFLKYIFAIFVVAMAYNGLSYLSVSKVQSYSLILSSLILSYISGRLNKLSKNRMILLFIFVLLLVSCIYSIITFDASNLAGYGSLEISIYKWSYINIIIQYSTLTIAYLGRCFKHLKAGEIADAENEI